MLTVIGVLVVIGLALLVASILGKCQLWIPVLFLFVIELLRLLPVGH